jgi:predicted enzyme related to lactoylglutathione lyase
MSMPGITAIGQIAINVQDMPRAVQFYRDVLGLRHLFDAGPGLSFFDCAGVRLMLDVAQKKAFDHPGSILYYKVPDLQAAHQALLKAGVKFEQEPRLIAAMPTHDLWMAFAYDPEGNLFALMSEVPKA